jgi:glutathione synthase/RimK-type ligase-like ATP-grasp enzyme
VLIGIHDRPGSFSDRWREYCREREIQYQIIDCLGSDIVSEAKRFDAILWHWSHLNLPDVNVAKQVITALELGGALVFPNVATSWHFDDKIAQKLLLEAIGAPHVRTWVFNEEEEARRWIAEADWPKVFKLRCGAGAKNVRLAKSRRDAERLCDQAFTTGFAAKAGHLMDIKNRLRKINGIRSLANRLRRLPGSFKRRHELAEVLPRQRGYLYFQDFLPGNAFDTRVVVIGNRAFAFLRYNRPNDFRASGSNDLCFDSDLIDHRFLEAAFFVSKRIGAQSLAFDFLKTAEGEPAIVEMSYCFRGAMRYCAGYWDDEMEWHAGSHRPEDLILEDIVDKIGD